MIVKEHRGETRLKDILVKEEFRAYAKTNEMGNHCVIDSGD